VPTEPVLLGELQSEGGGGVSLFGARPRLGSGVAEQAVDGVGGVGHVVSLFRSNHGAITIVCQYLDRR
jgi:hypothetical protein